MTPAVDVLEKQGYRFTLHLYAASTGGNYGINAAQKLALDPEQVFKSLVIDLDNAEPIIVLVPVSKQLNMKKLAKCAGVKRACMLATESAEKLTGYVIGGICPIGLKRPLNTFVDSSIERFPNIFLSAGKRGVELEMDSEDFLELTGATVSALAD